MLTRSLSKLMLCSPTSMKSIACTKFSVVEGDSSAQLNYLLLIPDEILSRIFSHLPLADIGLLCLTGSSLLTNRVVAWINSSLCAKQVCMMLNRDMMCHQPQYYEMWVKRCKQFGLLCKRASMLSSTSSRLRLLADVYTKIEVVLSAK